MIISLPLETFPAEAITQKIEAPIQTSTLPLNVLVVDDHPANRLLMCQQLEFLGHHFSIAEDGRSGFDQWKTGRFDLVIADCNMPLMNGYELTRAIRQHEQQSSQPPCIVLGFTANALPEEVQRCKQAGMNDCLFKPLSLSVLSQWVSGIHPMVRSQTFNFDGLNVLTGGNPVQAQRLMAELLKSNRLDRQELLTLSPETDRQALAVIAHKIKGAARIAQASQLIECCDALEHACEQALPAHEISQRREASNLAMLDLEQALQLQLTLTGERRKSEP